MKKQIIKRLRTELVSIWLVALLFVVLCETDVFDISFFADNTQVQYILGTVAIGLTIILMPFSLQLFHNRVKNLSDWDNIETMKSFRRYSEIRLAIVALVLLADVIVYYMVLQGSAGLCSLMSLFITFFCWPSESQMCDKKIEE